MNLTFCFSHGPRGFRIVQVVPLMLGLLAGCGSDGYLAQNPSTRKSDQPMAMAALSQAVESEQSPNAAAAQKPFHPVTDRETFEQHVRPFIAKHCIRCHGSETAEAKLRLDSLAADFLDRPSVEQWSEVLNRLNLGEMPPPDEPRPEIESLTRTIDWITSELKCVQGHMQSTSGRALLRRLTRHEYSNTVRDLFNVEFIDGQGPSNLLPPDGSLGGFDRVSKALLLDPSLMEAYLTVAQQVVDQAVVFRPPAVSQRTLRFEFERTKHTGAIAYILDNRDAEIDGDFLVIMQSAARSYGKLQHPFNDKEIPVTGRYRVRVRAAADRGARNEPIYMDVTYGASGRQARFRVDATKESPAIYEFEKAFDALTPGEFGVAIVNGTRFQEGNAEWYQRNNELTKLAENGKAFESLRMKARMRAEGEYDSYVRSSYLPAVLHTENLPKLYLDWIEVIGPLQSDYPPASMQTVFGSEEVSARFATRSTNREQLLKDSRAILARIMPRAFRRPVQSSEIEEVAKLADAELQAGVEPQQAIKTGLVAILSAPSFLYLIEPSVNSNTPRSLNDHELAARLSYFFWSTMPDERLTRLANEKRLSQPSVFSAEVDRMLADRKMEGFVEGFARQWLKVDEYGRFPPDEQIYPDYYATDMVGIDKDVQQEPLAFFREVFERDEPIASFLDSDWLMLNERLAKLYGITGVQGPQLRRVSLDGDNGIVARRRGGLLGMAGVHLWGADGNRTKPVERGKYILTVLFNDPPSPPPPNAGEVEPNLAGKILTVRERLALHREQTTCNHCHRRIDPYGLALENFNAIGQWRDRLDGEKPLRHWNPDRPVIDSSGTLPNGRQFTDFLTFKLALREQQDRFAKALAEKLFLYAMGRTVEPGDQATIDAVKSTDAVEKLTFRAMLRAVVNSPAFRLK